jgi:hypothetical protein
VLNTTVTIPNAAYIHVLAIREWVRGYVPPQTKGDPLITA